MKNKPLRHEDYMAIAERNRILEAKLVAMTTKSRPNPKFSNPSFISKLHWIDILMASIASILIISSGLAITCSIEETASVNCYKIEETKHKHIWQKCEYFLIENRGFFHFNYPVHETKFVDKQDAINFIHQYGKVCGEQ